MVKTKELIICIISIIALILTITTNVFATDDIQDINALLGNTVTNMNDQKVQTFNSSFTAYEGNKNGATIKQLFSTVKSSNEFNPEHKVTLSGVSEENIESTKEYTVSLQKDTAGYVNQITIKENTEFQVIGGTNNTSNANTTNNTTNANTTNNTTNTMPNTGVSYSSLVVIAIAAVSAVYAYKKIKEYNV